MNQHVTHLFAKWLNHQLSETQRQEVSQHLSLCPSCRTYFERLEQAMEAAGELPEGVSAPQFAWKPPAPASISRSSPVLPVIRWAAVIIAALFSGVLLGILGVRQEMPATEWVTFQQEWQSIDAQLVSPEITQSIEYLAGGNDEN